MDSTNDKKVAFEFFNHHPLMTITTVTAGGAPQSAAVYVFLKDDYTAYCVSRESTRKYANIMQNSHVALSVYDESLLMFGELTGEAEVLQSIEEVSEVLPKLQEIVASRKSDYWIPPVSQITGENYVFIKIKPHQLHFTNYSNTADQETVSPSVVNIDLHEE